MAGRYPGSTGLGGCPVILTPQYYDIYPFAMVCRWHQRASGLPGFTSRRDPVPERKITSRDALGQEHTRPSRARRALLTGGALSLAAVAGSALGGAQPASANSTENVIALEPSGGDDTKAINTALTTAATSGGIVVLAGGTFNISSSIIPQGGVLLLGEKGTVIQAASGMTEHMISVATHTTTPSTFACFTLDGGNGSAPFATGGTQPAFNGINIAAQLTRFMIFDVTIQNISQDALSISGGSMGGANVIGLQVLDALRHGISTNQASDLRFTNCEVDNVGQYSYLVGGTQQDFYNCKSNASGMLGVTTVGTGSSGTTIAVNNVTSSYYPSSGTLQISQPVPGETGEFEIFQVPYGGVTITGDDITAFTKCTLGSYSPATGDTVGRLQTAVDGSGTADAWHVTSGSVNIKATIQNDLYGNGIYVAAANCRVDVEAGNAGNALLVLDGASRNMIDMQVSKWGNYIGPPSYVYALNGTNTGNVARIAGANPNANPPVYNTAYALLSGSATEAGNYFDLECENTGALQNVTYATKITPDPYLGGTINCDLGGDIMINNTADALSEPVGHIGSEMVISLKQPAAGGASVTWGSAYTASTPINTAASARTTWRFKCLSYSGGVPQWDEIA
jgi:hypothetical protein